MGLEKMGINKFEEATTTLTPAILHGKVVHGLAGGDVKLVESHYGRPFSDTEFYGQLIITVEHTPTPIDPSNGEDILKLGLLKAEGKLAPSILDQDDVNKNYEFVLSEEGQDEEVKASVYRRRGKAIAALDEMDRKDRDYMVTVAKYLTNFSGGIKTTDQAYAKLTEFIEGKLSAKAGEAIDVFLDALDESYGGKLPRQELNVRVDIERALKTNIIRFDHSRGCYYNVANADSNYGRNKDEVVSYLLQPSNMDELGTGSSKDKPYSVRLQLHKKNVS